MKDICYKSKHKDNVSHGWLFDGDDPYIICIWCKEIRDSINGRIIQKGEK